MEQWAEIRRLALVEGLSQREIRRRTGAGHDTIRNAVASADPPSYRPRPKRPSKLDRHRARIEELLDDEPTLSGVRILEEIQLDGYDGGQTILDAALRELRPRYLPPPRSFQRTIYRPGELCQFDLTEPRREVPVGWGQTRKGYIVTAKLPYSRAFAGALIFSKEFADIAWGMNRCLARLGGSVGDAYDNSMAVNFVDSFKTELIADRVWRDRSELELAIVEWVAWFTRPGCTSRSETCHRPSSRL